MKTGNSLNAFILIVILFSSVNAFSCPSASTESRSEDISLYTDCNHYSPGESILFKAYINRNENTDSKPVNDTLFVVLLDQDGIEVTIGIFPLSLNQVEGDIALPDFLTDGYYVLLASTHPSGINGPDDVYSGIIEIKKSSEDDFLTFISLSDTVYKPESNLKAIVRFTGRDGKPLTASFKYQLTGRSGIILSGDGKADKEGIGELSLVLPEFNDSEKLRLLVTPSYKGNHDVTGIVIPTPDYPVERIGKPYMSSQTGRINYLHVTLNTDKLKYSQKEKVLLDIKVTDENGNPVIANMVVSASKIMLWNDEFARPGSLENDLSIFNQNWRQNVTLKQENAAGIVNLPSDNYGMKMYFTPETRTYFAACLVLRTQSPGIQYPVQEKNNIKKIQREKEKFEQINKIGYSPERNIYDILMQIKPYHIENGKIIFGMNNMSSFTNQEGALIVVDGIKMGTDANILNNIPVIDIAKITASTSPSEIQKYSALNSIGVIEIIMKKNSALLKKEEANNKSRGQINSNVIFWAPEVVTDNSGKASVNFFTNNEPADIKITVGGVSTKGLSGSSTIYITVE